MDIEIIKANIEQLNTLVEFQLLMAKETEDLDLDEDVLRQGIYAGILDSGRAIYYIAKSDKDIVGSLMITKEWSDWRNKWVIWIQSVFVPKEYRGKGVYKALYGYIKDIADNNDEYSGIRLYVDTTNVNAQKVYSKLGMDSNHYQLFESMIN